MIRATPSGEHQQTVQLWCEFFKSVVGADYTVTAKDGLAVKAMLKSGLTPGGIIDLARKAQKLDDKFLVEQAITLPGLNGSLNKIQAALKVGGGTKLPTKATKSESEMVSQLELNALAKQKGTK